MNRRHDNPERRPQQAEGSRAGEGMAGAAGRQSAARRDSAERVVAERRLAPEALPSEEAPMPSTRSSRMVRPPRMAPAGPTPHPQMRRAILSRLSAHRSVRQAMIVNEIIGPPKALRTPE